MSGINPYSAICFIVLSLLVLIKALQRGFKNMDKVSSDESEALDHIKHGAPAIPKEQYASGPFGYFTEDEKKGVDKADGM